MKFKPVLFALPMLLLQACTTPRMQLSSDLASAMHEYPVKGRQGVMINQQLSFGEFATTRIQRGWLKSYDIPFFIRFSGSSEKLTFGIRDSALSAGVSCIAKVRRQEFEAAREIFGITLKSEDAFAGHISVPNHAQWEFIIHNASNTDISKTISGHARSGETLIEIVPVRRMQGKNTTLSEFGLYGYELRLDKKTIGAVELINKGRVFMARDLTPEHRVVVASLTAAVLLKTDIDAP